MSTAESLDDLKAILDTVSELIEHTGFPWKVDREYTTLRMKLDGGLATVDRRECDGQCQECDGEWRAELSLGKDPCDVKWRAEGKTVTAAWDAMVATMSTPWRSWLVEQMICPRSRAASRDLLRSLFSGESACPWELVETAILEVERRAREEVLSRLHPQLAAWVKAEMDAR